MVVSAVRRRTTKTQGPPRAIRVSNEGVKGLSRDPIQGLPPHGPDGQGGDGIICAHLEVVKAVSRQPAAGWQARAALCWCASWRSAKLPPAILHRGAHAADRARGHSRSLDVVETESGSASAVNESSLPGPPRSEEHTSELQSQFHL